MLYPLTPNYPAWGFSTVNGLIPALTSRGGAPRASRNRAGATSGCGGSGGAAGGALLAPARADRGRCGAWVGTFGALFGRGGGAPWPPADLLPRSRFAPRRCARSGSEGAQQGPGEARHGSSSSKRRSPCTAAAPRPPPQVFVGAGEGEEGGSVLYELVCKVELEGKAEGVNVCKSACAEDASGVHSNSWRHSGELCIGYKTQAARKHSGDITTATVPIQATAAGQLAALGKVGVLMAPMVAVARAQQPLRVGSGVANLKRGEMARLPLKRRPFSSVLHTRGSRRAPSAVLAPGERRSGNSKRSAGDAGRTEPLGDTFSERVRRKMRFPSLRADDFRHPLD